MNQILDKLEQIHGSVSVVGSMNADYTVTTERLPGPGETVTGGPLQVLPGGKSGNQAAAAAKLGATVRMFGAVGSDSNADFLLTQLASAGVNTDGIRKVLGPSGTTVITVDSHGENTIVYSPGSNANVTVEYIESQRDLLTASSVLGLCLESPLETVTACATMCHDAGMKVLLNDSPFIATLPSELIAHADILLVNEHELVQLLHIDEPEDDDWDSFDWAQAQNRLSEFGFDQAIVTLGGDGSVVHGHCAGFIGQWTELGGVRATGFVCVGICGHRLWCAGLLWHRRADSGALPLTEMRCVCLVAYGAAEPMRFVTGSQAPLRSSSHRLGCPIRHQTDSSSLLQVRCLLRGTRGG